MDKDVIAESRQLYLRLQRKNAEEPREYTMTEIGKISERVLEIIEREDSNHKAVYSFKTVEERSDYFHTSGGQQFKVPANIEEVKELAMQAFQQLFDREPGIAP